jgi:FkbM family methyltransferase
VRKRLRQFRADLRRWLHEAVGSARYSRPALNGLDVKLEQYLKFDRGYFIEAGAHDGFTYSNTYYFERCRQWTGLLIEPVPALFTRCRRRRPASVVVQAALVGPASRSPTVELEYGDLMTRVPDPEATPEENARFAELRHTFLPNEKPYRFTAPARTLSSLLDEHAPAQVVDLLSLDVEGYEVEALRGLDLTRHRPRFICVETWHKPSVDELLAPYYDEVAILHAEPHLCDVLYRVRTAPAAS